MAKLYWTRDVAEVIEHRMAKMADTVTKDTGLTDEQIVNAVHELREFRRLANMILTDMAEIDRKDDEEMAAYRARKAAEEAGDGSDS